ncbi:DVU0524 family FlgM-associated protein [Desulfovulcanus sp.]
MTVNSFLVKNIIRVYDRQLTNGRRIARLKKYLQQAGQGDSVTISKEAKRRQLVERVAREIIDNLITSGSNNPIVQEIKLELEKEFNQKFIFHYPPSGEEMQILKQGTQGPEELKAEEKDTVLHKLWEITLHKVNETML